FLDKNNIGLGISRSIETGRGWEHAIATKYLLTHHSVSLKEVNYLLPVWLYGTPNRVDLFEDDLFSDLPSRHTNFANSFLAALKTALDLRSIDWKPESSAAKLNAESIFGYIYAILYSPNYRTRYAEFLKIDFPRLPLTHSLPLFQALAKLGGELVSLHLLESPKLNHFITEYQGKGDDSLPKKPVYKDGAVWINASQRFEKVPEAVWNFHIGGYQVCEKWLKDRKSRRLSAEDVAHYQKIVVALHETLRLMAEIDTTIAQHGGWPGAFQTQQEQAL
ncbi:MAG: type ISP restriction/modification enzyme, partial [Candidatus Methylumidiphilus sp.]